MSTNNDQENPASNVDPLGITAFGDPAKSGELEMTVIRANGDVEELGVVAYYHRNPIINWWVNRKIKRRQKNVI
jgi:hypothetical protein